MFLIENFFLFSLQKIGCRLKIFSNIAPQSTDRIAQIVGKEEQCIECLTEIMDLIKTVNVFDINLKFSTRTHRNHSVDSNQRTNS